MLNGTSASQQAGSPQLVGLIGAGILNSSSPALHMDEAAAQGFSLRYELMDLDARAGANLAELLDEAERRGFLGVNVTFPCKQSVIPLLHELSSEARALNAVNTVQFRGGRRIGHNTDWWGFAESFKRGLPGAPLDCVALIGAGGAGSAVGFAVLNLGARRLQIFDAEQARSEALALRLTALFPGTAVHGCASLEATLSGASGLLHATPTGMQKMPGLPVPAACLRPPLWVADVVYVPLNTELLRTARAAGCIVLDGSGMAIFQAVRAFELFTGRSADSARMSTAFRSRLQSTAVAVGATLQPA